MTQRYTLYDYFRSSASYRVRIALNLKGLPYTQIPIDLRLSEQKNPDYLTKNPQGLVPSLNIGNDLLTQSLSIIEYLDEIYPSPPLLTKNPLLKAKIRSFALVIACDIHPLNNLRVLNYLKEGVHFTDEQKNLWYHHWLKEGFNTLEALLTRNSSQHPFCFTEHPSLADICLIPQIFNAQRFQFDLAPYPRCLEIYERAAQIDAFIKAAP